MGREILFIDAGLHDWRRIAANVRPDVDIVVLDPHLDPFAQVVDTFACAAPPVAVHIASRGDADTLSLGMRRVNLCELPGHATPLAALSGSLVYVEDAMLYSSEFATSADADAFLDKLQEAGKQRVSIG